MKKLEKNWVDIKISQLIVPRKKKKLENWILGPRIRPQAFQTHSLYFKTLKINKCEEGSNSRFNSIQIGPYAFGPWTLI